MFGHLVPCGGGRSIPLLKPRLVLGPRRTDGNEGERKGHAELRFLEGAWTVRRLPDGSPLRINDVPCEGGTLYPTDILSVGANRYRVAYPADGKAASAPTPATAPVKQAVTVFGVLVPCGGGPAFPMKKHRIVLGRAATCDLILEHKTVSTHHCGLKFTGHWQVRDLDSTNGTLIDGVPYRCKWLFPGDILSVGIHRFRIEYFPEGPRPATQDEDVPAPPTRSLMASVGLTEDGLSRATQDEEPEEVPRPRWNLNE